MLKYVTDKIPSYNISSNVDAFFAQIEERIEAAGVPRGKISIDIEYEHDYGDSICATARVARCSRRRSTTTSRVNGQKIRHGKITLDKISKPCIISLRSTG